MRKLTIEEENEYYAELEAAETHAEAEEYAFAGGYEAARGDYEGAAMARHEYYWGGTGGLL